MSINSKSATNAASEHKEAAEFSASPMFTDCQLHHTAISQLRYHKEDLSKTHRSGIRTSRPLTREEPKKNKNKKPESISCNPLSTVGRIYVIATTALDRYWSRDQYRRGRHATSRFPTPSPRIVILESQRPDV
ncbi:hypothetical protein AVEN_169500-1 [Araneus ventricosus]|uniref:Uncharacterized protein n=1 Tax=Araneus ventricosus TaxID=182803 RepID=A0A4Y2TJQ0_ARAVE|nr:hypothetical protein AVEN_169500-1 [Araneus ventricosus]